MATFRGEGSGPRTPDPLAFIRLQAGLVRRLVTIVKFDLWCIYGGVRMHTLLCIRALSPGPAAPPRAARPALRGRDEIPYFPTHFICIDSAFELGRVVLYHALQHIVSERLGSKPTVTHSRFKSLNHTQREVLTHGVTTGNICRQDTRPDVPHPPSAASACFVPNACASTETCTVITVHSTSHVTFTFHRPTFAKKKNPYVFKDALTTRSGRLCDSTQRRLDISTARWQGVSSTMVGYVFSHALTGCCHHPQP